MQNETSTNAVDAYLKDTEQALADLSRQAIVTTVSLLFDAWAARRQVFILGNGGSASTASHMGNDFSKATIVEGMPRMKVIGLADNVALMTAWANDTSYDEMFKEQLENLLEPGDVVIGISASGNSPNVLRAMEFARARGAVTIAWTGLSGGRVKDLCDHTVHAPTNDVGMIEGVHLVIDHAVTTMLRRRIEAASLDPVMRTRIAVAADARLAVEAAR